jgi:tetraacyldisaccharide 4'-kinase
LLFDKKILRAFSPAAPSIGIGNLSTGGTGKSPLAAMISGYFSGKKNIVFVSRGYGRKTRGFRIAGEGDTAETIGDEPYQIHKNYRDIKVVVDHRRVRAVKKILAEHQDVDLIIFDDIFQHRRIKPGLNIMLTEYSKPFFKDYILPVGNLREFRSGKKRADVIIVTKTPAVFSPIERRHLIQQISPQGEQKVLFSYLRYTGLLHFESEVQSPLPINKVLNKETEVMAFCGIGNPDPFEDFIRENSSGYQIRTFPDHHFYTLEEFRSIIQEFAKMKAKNKVLLTTEKDMARLRRAEFEDMGKGLSFFSVRIAPAFHPPDDQIFEQIINQHAGQL